MAFNPQANSFNLAILKMKDLPNNEETGLIGRLMNTYELILGDDFNLILFLFEVYNYSLLLPSNYNQSLLISTNWLCLEIFN